MTGMSSLLAALDAVDAQPVAVELRARSHELSGDVGDLSGRTVVDADCGGGRAVAELAERGARAGGADLDPEMIAGARERWPAGEFHVGDACELSLETAASSGYRTDMVLHTLDVPARAAKARRVLAPGGRPCCSARAGTCSPSTRATRSPPVAGPPEGGLAPVAAPRLEVPQFAARRRVHRPGR
jgi:2-polyprenyl-3-methyl-5-hydroxy-6-metoxy-1,4-benzoquinol methylase